MSIWNEEHTVEVYSLGIVCCSVCAPQDMTAEEVVAEVNRFSPTGISSDWQLSEDKAFRDGTPHPCPCPDNATRKHWLMVC